MCSCKNYNKNLTPKKEELKIKKIETVKYKTVLIDKKVKNLVLEYLEN